MLVFEFKAYGKSSQMTAVNDAIRTAKFIRNSCIRLWIDVKGTGKNDLQKYCAVLAANFPFANELDSMARPALVLKEHGRLSLVFMKTAKRAFLARKVFPSSRKTVTRLSTKRQDGSLQIIENS